MENLGFEIEPMTADCYSTECTTIRCGSGIPKTLKRCNPTPGQGFTPVYYCTCYE